LYLLVTPVLVGFIVNLTNGIIRDVEYTYDSTAVSALYTTAENSTYGSAIQLQTYIFDNTTLTASIVSLDYPIIASMTIVNVFYEINWSKFIDSNIYKIEIKWAYVGTGNITELWVQMEDISTGPVQYTPIGWTTDLAENDTIVWVPETFQILKMVSYSFFRLKFRFTDSSNLPSIGDYFEVSVKFYKKDTLITKEQLIQGILGFLAIVNILIAVFITSLIDVKDIKKLFK